ncbi:MAG: delta-60 repeat domain-containing protein [Actinobacteria bacterium]|nr:delta-60 repeat domain-containing protein [Actinomycetota bacterium]
MALVLQAAPASAALNPNPDVTWMTNGQVRALLVYGDYLYIGGRFTSVREYPPGVSGGGSFSAKNLARIDLATGAGDPTWTPKVSTDVTGPAVFALAGLGDQIWVGGAFTAVDGEPRLNLAAVSATTGTVDPAVTPQVGVDTSDRVDALASGQSLVYAGGFFTKVNGLQRKRLAAFHSDGTLDPTWKPRVDERVFSMALDCSGSSLFVGGQFRSASSPGGLYVDRETVAQFDLSSGALLDWAIPAGVIPTGQKAYDMAPTCTRLFVGYGGQNWASAFALDDGSTGLEVWRTKTDGNVQAIEFTGDRVVIGGHFLTVAKASYLRIASLDPATGIPDSTWNPGVQGQWGGPWDMAVEDSHLWFGGQFKQVASSAQYFLARFTF